MPEQPLSQSRQLSSLKALVLIVLSVVGLSTIAAFAFAASAQHRSFASSITGRLRSTFADSLLDNTGQRVGDYCPIPPRGSTNHSAAVSRAGADTLLTTGQSIVPDSSGAALCTGTAATQPLLHAPKSDR